MKLGSRNMEWIIIVVLIVTTLAVFLAVSAGMMASEPQALTNLTILMVFGGEMLLGIILLRMYDKLSSILDILEEKS